MVDTRRRLLAGCIAACLTVLPTACSGGNEGNALSSSAVPLSDDALLTASDYPPGYQLLQGKSAADVAAFQRQTAANRTFTPSRCAQIFADQAERTAASQRTSMQAKNSDPTKPAFGNVLIHNGESLGQLREVYRVCGNFTATIPNQGTLRMIYFDQPAPQELSVRDSYVVDTIVRTTPVPGSTSTPAVQNQVSGYAQLDGNRQVLFFAETYGAGNQVDMNQFNDLFTKAVRRAASVE